jgi:phosphatidylinositol dimannoside acyltransferase
MSERGNSLLVARSSLLYWVVRGASALLSIIPVRLSYALAGAIGEAYCVLRPSHSRWAAYNLARVLNESPTAPVVRKIARQSFGNYARVLVDFLRLPHVAHAEIMAQASVLDLETLARAAAYDKGFILVTGHMGSWDRAGALLTGYGYPSVFLVDTFSPPALDAWVTRMRRKFRMSAVAVGNPGALREMYRALQRKEVLVLLIDTPDPSGSGIPVTFFGEQTTFPAGVAQLAVRTGCPIVVAGLFRRPDFVSYDGFIRLIPPVAPAPDPEAAAQALTQRVASILEEAIVAHPAQWYMFRPMWRERAED